MLLWGAVVLTVLIAGFVWVEDKGLAVERTDSEATTLTSELRRQEGELDRATGGLARVGAELEESQGRVDEARTRQKDLGRRVREMDDSLKVQKKASDLSRSRLEDQVRVAYKGAELEGLLLLLGGFFKNDYDRDDPFTTLQTTRLITESSRSIQSYKDKNQSLRSTVRQLEERKAEYREFGAESQALVEELEWRKAELQASVEEMGFQRGRMEERLAQLEVEEEAGLLVRPPATGGGREEKMRDHNDVQEDGQDRGDVREDEQDRGTARGDGQDRNGVRKDRQDRNGVRRDGSVREVVEEGGQDRDEALNRRVEGEKDRNEVLGRRVEGEGEQAREREIEIARNDIASRPVEPMPYEEYVRLYKGSAERYGFGEDWYVLAAVGKIESNHGENMGPSGAGAMGPMQFLPSTWSSYGVDGNGDGEANIMDPEDAVPAAAAYLKAGGAPGDWYTALFTYNRAEWYVEEVLAIAENYRRIHGDDTVGPYLEPVPAEEAPPRSEPAPMPESVPDGEGLREKQPMEDVSPPPDEDTPPTGDGPKAEEGTVVDPESPAEPEEATTEQYQH